MERKFVYRSSRNCRQIMEQIYRGKSLIKATGNDFEKIVGFFCFGDVNAFESEYTKPVYSMKYYLYDSDTATFKPQNSREYRVSYEDSEVVHILKVLKWTHLSDLQTHIAVDRSKANSPMECFGPFPKYTYLQDMEKTADFMKQHNFNPSFPPQDDLTEEKEREGMNPGNPSCPITIEEQATADMDEFRANYKKSKANQLPQGWENDVKIKTVRLAALLEEAKEINDWIKESPHRAFYTADQPIPLLKRVEAKRVVKITFEF